MPPKKIKKTSSPIRTRRSRRTNKSAEDEIPQVYREMLADAEVSSLAESGYKPRPSKRRKVNVEITTPSVSDPVEENGSPVEKDLEFPASDSPEQRPQQIVYDDFEDSDYDSDADFEDVVLEPEDTDVVEEPKRPEQKSLQLDLSISAEPSTKRTVQRRKPVTKAEREFRLYVHKYHLLLLLLNIQRRRYWCESEEIQAFMKPLIPRNLISLLHVSDSKPEFQRSHSFNKAIEEICSLWTREWKITVQGMRSASWREEVDAVKESENYDDPSSYEEFKEASSSRSGSRDLGAILFCALLRSAAVETRLVCSLQVLPLSSVTKSQTPSKPKSQYAYTSPWTGGNSSGMQSDGGDLSNPRWRRSEYFEAAAPIQETRPSKRKIRDSPHPIFWVEVLHPTTHTWIPLDPLVRNTINKPKTGFEPALSDTFNSMSYVIAFEDSGFAKDVTRRYTQFFNAKTRKTRVESSKGGVEWWKRTIGWFEKFKEARLARDDIEDDEFARRADSEPMPNNISDFNGHPVFVLERHIRRNEVIWPKTERGQIAAGNKDGKMEKVYDRKNVHIARSADQWYRRGRDVRVGEQGLKRIVPRKRVDLPPDDEEEEQQHDGTILYAEFQTEVYIPPPVVRGRIPKNAYGNLDIYVPNMIPPGAMHVQHPEARNAAKILEIDFTDAVTGFDFKGRQGTAVINGIIAALEYREALVEVVGALEHEKVTAEDEKRNSASLQLWKRFMTALRIRAKVEADYGNADEDGSEKEVTSPADSEDGETYSESDADEGGGGFVPEVTAARSDDQAMDTISISRFGLPTERAVYHRLVIIESPHSLQQPGDTDDDHSQPPATKGPMEDRAASGGGGFIVEDDYDLFGDSGPGGGEIVPEDSNETQGAGGFTLDDDVGNKDMGGGGFIPDEVSDTQASLNTPAPTDANVDDGTFSTDRTIPIDQRCTTDFVERGSLSHMAEAEDLGKQEAVDRDEDRDEDDQEDVTPLLSEDPSDEDAEPEWLMDVDE